MFLLVKGFKVYNKYIKFFQMMELNKSLEINVVVFHSKIYEFQYFTTEWTLKTPHLNY